MTSFPTSLDTLTNPTATDSQSTVSHADQHINANDAIEALEAKVGVNSSAVATSLDYKVTNASSSNPGHVHTLASGATDVTASVTEINYVDGVTSAIQTQLDAKVDENVAITGATKTKITYDAKGLVTVGADATTADIAASTDKNYVTDAQAIVIGNTSGTNTGDNAVNSNYSSLTQYTDELAQDAVGGMVNTTLTYTDGTPELKVTNPVTPQAVGFTISAGTTAKTLTVALDASVAGTNTGDNADATVSTKGIASFADADFTVTSGAVTIDDKFLLNNGDVGTGVYDFGGADSFEIPNGAGGTTVNATGEVTVDTTSRTFNIYDGTAEAVINPVMSKAITIETPSATDDITMFYTDDAITITKIVYVITGSTSVTSTVRHHTDRNNAGNEVVTSGTVANSTTTGNVVTSFNDATIPADSFVWIENTALSSTPTSLGITIFFRQDA